MSTIQQTVQMLQMLLSNILGILVGEGFVAQYANCILGEDSYANESFNQNVESPLVSDDFPLKILIILQKGTWGATIRSAHMQSPARLDFQGDF